MAPKELQSLLQAANDEIVSLRGRLAVAEAKSEVIDLFRTALAVAPSGGTYGIDIAWRLRERIAELQPKDVVAASSSGL